MMTLNLQCGRCKHYRGNMTCDAFPEFGGIPQEIFALEFDHRQPFPGDNGIRWEPAEPGSKHPFDEEDERE